MSAEFADTNVVLYLLDDGPKADRAEVILGQGPRISVQVLNETLVNSVKQRIEQNIEMVSPEFYLKQWYSMGGQATDSFMQMMTAGARATHQAWPWSSRWAKSRHT